MARARSAPAGFATLSWASVRAITRRSSSARDAMVPLPGGAGYALRMIADACGDTALSAATVIISPSNRKTTL